MNKLVYLYELDSTRISPWEIDRGRKALYEEIVMRGNRVVLTFQQLTAVSYTHLTLPTNSLV